MHLLGQPWTKLSVHYIALYACYNWTTNRKDGAIVPTKFLLSVAPMPEVARELEENDSVINKTIKFSADMHASFMRSTFCDYYATVDIDKWIVCQIADNTA